MSQETAAPVRGSTDVIDRVWRFLFGSVFRFLTLLGVVLFGLAVFWADGVVAGHLGLYAASLILVGIVGQVIVWWRIQDEY